MSNLTSTIKSIQDIMRKDAGVDGDAQRNITNRLDAFPENI
jgi:hypothetical protein